MADQNQTRDIQAELEQLLAELKKDRQAFGVKSKVLVAQANRLADELEKANLSEMDESERKAATDLRAAVAEEVSSLEADGNVA